MLKQYHPLYINVHFNHPDEITPRSAAALARLADAGIPLGSQTVLLRGVNDDPEIMRELENLVMLKVVDNHWMEHLDAMDMLREGVGLRAYGQKDPIVEYKFQAFQAFHLILHH